MTAAGPTSPDRGSSRAEPHVRRGGNGRPPGSAGRPPSEGAPAPVLAAVPATPAVLNAVAPPVDASRPAIAAAAETASPVLPLTAGNSGQNEKAGNFAATVAVSTVDVTITEDQQLIDACLAGEGGAFDQLVLKYQDRLYNSLVRILRSAEDARDVAQEAWVHAFHRLDTFRGNSAFYSWLFRIAYNAAVSEKRKVRVSARSLDAARDNAGVDPADLHPEGEPSHRMEVTERQARVRAALDELSEEYRTVLVLKEMEDLKYDEIAELVGCPIGTVRSRIHRARLELHDKLRLLFQDGGL